MIPILERMDVPLLLSPSKKVAFLPILKNAHAYFTASLSNNNWQKIHPSNETFNEILSTAFLVGFISDPYRRYAKGVVQDLLWLGLENTLPNNVGRNFWQWTPTIGVHTVSPTTHYGNLFDKTFWIPFDNRKINFKNVFNDILKEKGEDPVDFIEHRIHESPPFQKQLTQDIYERILGEGTTWYDILYYKEVANYKNQCKNIVELYSQDRKENFKNA
jgi:hypothetical protein